MARDTVNCHGISESQDHRGLEERLCAWEKETKESTSLNCGILSAWEGTLYSGTSREREHDQADDMSSSKISRLITLEAMSLGPVCTDIAEQVFLTMGLCLSVELMILNAASVEPDQLGVFAGPWLSTSTHGLLPLHDFTVSMTTTCTYTPECNVIAVMLIIRLLLYHPQVNLKWAICKRLLLVAILVAQKFWDDYPLRNIDFTTAWSRVAPNEAPLSIKDVNALECIFLGAIGFDLFIHVPQYQSFCNELCATVQHRQTTDGGQVSSLMQHHASLLQTRKVKCWYAT
mmetsp:Transcript_28178/g.90824  ORF Transcript_28178/g.90824 Transcript_28178/m.90824 type:complete len:288 (+) Transcript_28178:277-1140(+)|eukprot:CAMPEP_0118890596 /NCGR_PEP_ID=MMETSP1166-20130328/982_1 /TAXON_ID=1104430 /ORGANISM="Chrysoreinhardia sp, Strain CCMP3193" /LENGTH=287 /DNA_ID=CAMNT_0006829213 /DNA_START=204 /DNA_END=1067 /DNA_ORIENTATION=-